MKFRTFLRGLSLGILFTGCSPDSSTSQLCEQSGGVWKEVSDCPSACAPPAPTADSCANIEETSCIAVCGDVPTCSCPEEMPFWKDGAGCVGIEACPDSDTGTQE